MGNKIISINAGSSSLKASVATLDDATIVYETEIKNVKDFNDAAEAIVDAIKNYVDLSDIIAVGHRIVHGGSQRQVAREIDDEVLADMHRFAEFDPMHAQSALAIVGAMQQFFPSAKHIACFDTAFFHDIPRVAQIIPLPRKYTDAGIRRYGFHGLSYEYVLGELRTRNVDVDNEKIIIAHLGSGASLAAILDGRPIDMTMGFTPASGIVMSSRLGDSDPGLVGYLAQQFGVSAEEWTDITNKQSGLLAVSELSADMYTLIQAEATNPKAGEAVELFVYRVRQAIGALAASLNGIDRLVFTGGIGEASEILRQRIIDGVSFLPIQHFDVISTNENAVMIRNIKKLL